MSGKRDSARNALRRAVPFLAEQHHDAILNELDAESLLDGEGKTPNGGRVHAVAGDADRPKRPLLTPMQAAEARNGMNKDLVRSVLAQARRLGCEIKENELVSTAALDAAMTGNEDISGRLAIKAAMAKLALIP